MKLTTSCTGIPLCLYKPLTRLLSYILLLIFFNTTAQAQQQQQITGTVTDARTEQPVVGATVKLKGLNTATHTDEDGRFTLQSDRREGVLEISHLGYQAKEVPFKATEKRIAIALEPYESVLQEVEINAGYYTVTDHERTGSIARVDAQTIARQPVGNPLAALTGRVPGLEITQGSGTPGSGFKVRIRGQNSIGNGNDPLYIVNGVPINSQPLSSGNSAIMASYGASPLNAINPSDILSVEVLKDADATAIYGSRGANGVILITTKQGKEGPTAFSGTIYRGMGQVANQVDLLHTAQYLEMRREAFVNDGVVPTAGNAPDLQVWDTTRYTDWQKELLGGTAHTTDIQLSLSGGSAQTQFLIGGSLRKEGLVYPGNRGERRMAVNSNLQHRSANERLKLTFSVNYSNTESDLYGTDLTSIALSTPPNAPALYTPEGELNWENSTWQNPLGYLQQDYWSDGQSLIGNLLARYAITKNLSLQVSAGNNISSMYSGNTIPLSSLMPSQRASQQNRSNFSDRSFGNWIVEPQMNWNSAFKEAKLSILLGGTILGQETRNLSHTAQGYTDEALMRSITQAPSITVSADNATEYRYVAVYGRVNYNYRDRYIVNLTGRRDGSSRFGSDKRYANFGAVGAAWIFTEEPWMKSTSSFLSFGKLRGSVGITGNDQLGDYLFLDVYGAGGKYQGLRGIGSGRLTNSDLAWESNQKVEAALELSFIGNRLSFNVNFYQNRSSNQLLSYTLPPNTGFLNITRNLPATIENKGWEFEIRSLNIKRPHIQWSSSFNLGIPRNKLVSYPNLEASSDAQKYVIGEPLSLVKLYHFLGVDPETGVNRYEDTNNDGVINTADQQGYQFMGQLFNGGWQNTLRVKGFELAVFFQVVKQKGLKYYPSSPPGARGNQPAYVMDRWRDPANVGANAKFTQALLAQLSYGNYIYNDSNTGDNSFIRLKNIACSYDLPAHWCEKVRAKNARIFAQGQNLWTWTSFKGLDPESSNSFMPPLRVLTLGLSFTI